MSYKQDLMNYAAESKKRHRIVSISVKITMAVLAVAFLATVVCVFLNVASDGNGGSQSNGGSSSGRDRTPPVITLNEGDAIYAYVGENVLLKNAVTVKDSSKCELTVDNSMLDLNKAGVYEVVYTATDSAGNSSTLTVKVVVKKDQKYSSYSGLMDTVAAKAQQLGITANMTVTEKVRKIYDFVNSSDKSKAQGAEATIKWGSGTSMTPSIDRANWETDWVEEASRALEGINASGQVSGDCYTYYSVSKAFFEYLGIEHKGIQRDKSQSTEDGTHFWLMVNVGTTNAPQWYYYDATRLAGDFSDGTNNACLITLSKLQSYKSTSGKSGFYAFDQSKYPTAATTTIS